MAPDDEDGEIVVEGERPGVELRLRPVPTPPPRPAPPRPPDPRLPADLHADDYVAASDDGQQLVLFLRHPRDRCHFQRMVLFDGARRFEHPVPPWVDYGPRLDFGWQLLVGGCEEAWVVDWTDGARARLLHDPGSAGVEVCWLDGETAVAAGVRQIAIGAPAAHALLPCNGATLARPLCGGSLLVVTDSDGTQFIADGQVVARDWRTVVEARGDMVVTASGEAFVVRVSAG
jgi:hypothetical protein